MDAVILGGSCSEATPLVYELTMHYTGDAGSVQQGDDQVQTVPWSSFPEMIF